MLWARMYEVPNIWGTPGFRPLWMGRGWPPRHMLLPTCVTVPNSFIRPKPQICQKIMTHCARLLRSLKVSGTDMDRSTTYDVLLVFHCNYSPISYRFRDNGRYLQKKSHVLYLTLFPSKSFPWNCMGSKKTRMMPHPIRSSKM